MNDESEHMLSANVYVIIRKMAGGLSSEAGLVARVSLGDDDAAL